MAIPVKIRRGGDEKMIKNLVATLVGLLALFAIAGFLLPATQQVKRSLVIEDTPEQIWELLVDPPAWNRWSPWYERDPDMKITYTGAPKGEGAGWTWESSSEGNGSMVIVRTNVPRQLDYSISFGAMGRAIGQFVLEPTDAGTRVDWMLESDAGLNPLARWFGLMLNRYVGADFELGLSNMARALKKQGK